MSKKSQLHPSVQPTVTSNFTQVAATTTVSKLVRENPLRRELIVTNTSAAILYIMLGNLPSSTNYTVALTTGATFVTASTDALNGVWASAGGGGANITEEL